MRRSDPIVRIAEGSHEPPDARSAFRSARLNGRIVTVVAEVRLVNGAIGKKAGSGQISSHKGGCHGKGDWKVKYVPGT